MPNFADFMKKRLKCIFIIGVIVSIATGLLLLRERSIYRANQLQDYENSSTAFVLLSKGNLPFLVEVRVIDIHGNPVGGASIDIRNNSGGNSGTTSASGEASIKVGEREIEEILLDGQTVVNRPNAYGLGYPSVDNGLCVLIIKKQSGVK